jgi:methionyl-tRNA synthetase
MEGKKFSSSRGVVIYVKDFLERYQSDALRYYISIAGPENQDTDFTWQDFYQRTNSELVASWGNLVNRTANMIAKNFGEIPSAYDFELVDRELLDEISKGFDKIGLLIEAHHQKVALQELMKLVALTNTYISKTEPFKLKGDILGSIEQTQKRLSTILHVLAQAVVDLNTMFACFLPHSANKIHEIFGRTGGVDAIAALPYSQKVLDDNGKEYLIITGDYEIGKTFLSWQRHDVKVGAKIEKPEPVFIKLDESIVAQELDRMTGKD